MDVTGTGGGYYWREWRAGAPVSWGAGRPGSEPVLVLTVAVADAGALWEGAVSPSVSFMRGRLKAAGDLRLWLDLLAATARPEAQALLSPADGTAGS